VHTGNTYFIENIADRDAKLFFTQACKVRADEEEAEAPAPVVSSSGLTPQPRAVSVASMEARAFTQARKVRADEEEAEAPAPVVSSSGLTPQPRAVSVAVNGSARANPKGLKRGMSSNV
jgi:hypothetical protein